ncbi:MAG: hypothetical protein WD873_02870 [Candidatus Hydrogenedentales bacterium]
MRVSRDPSAALLGLCVRWWDRAAHADGDETLNTLLGYLGWENAASCDRAAWPAASAMAALDIGGGASAVLVLLPPGALEAPSALMERGLDFCQRTRAIVTAAAKQRVDLVVVTDLAAFYVYEVEAEEIILHADSPEWFMRDVAPEIAANALCDADNTELRRPPRSQSARQLRDWRNRWRKALNMAAGFEPEVEEGLADLALDRLIVLRVLPGLRSRDHSDRSLARRVSELACRAFRNEAGCGSALTLLFHDLWFDWKSDLFAPIPELDAALEQDDLAVPLLREWALLSKSKFSLSTVLESFNYGDAVEKARVRLVPEVDEARLRYTARFRPDKAPEDRVIVDLADEGYRAVFFWFDKLHEAAARYAEPAVRPLESAKPDPADGRPQLFEWEGLDAGPVADQMDPVRFAVERGLSIYYTSPRQSRTARLLLYLHVLETYRQAGAAFETFPHMESALQVRPKNYDNMQRLGRRTEERAGYDAETLQYGGV